MSEQPEKMGGNLKRHFLVSGKLNGGDFSITLSSERHVSPTDILKQLSGHGLLTGDKLTLQIGLIYEFKDEADYLDFKGESNEEA